MSTDLFPWEALLYGPNGLDQVGCIQARSRRECLDLATGWVRDGGRAHLFYQGIAKNWIGAEEGQFAGAI